MTRHARWYAIVGLAVLSGTILVVYAGVKARPLVEGPAIEIASPKEALVYERPRIAVIGTARNVSRLTLNGRQIYVDERGIFHETLLLNRGYTVLEVAGTDRFGREARVERAVVRK